MAVRPHLASPHLASPRFASLRLTSPHLTNVAVTSEQDARYQQGMSAVGSDTSILHTLTCPAPLITGKGFSLLVITSHYSLVITKYLTCYLLYVSHLLSSVCASLDALLRRLSCLGLVANELHTDKTGEGR